MAVGDQATHQMAQEVDGVTTAEMCDLFVGQIYMVIAEKETLAMDL